MSAGCRNTSVGNSGHESALTHLVRQAEPMLTSVTCRTRGGCAQSPTNPRVPRTQFDGALPGLPLSPNLAIVTMSRSLRVFSASLVIACVTFSGCGNEAPESQVASAKKYLAQNDSKAAYIQLRNALQQNPDLAEARFLLGKVMLDGGDLAAAAIELRKARALNYPADSVVPVLAKVLLSQGEFKKLIDDLASTVLATPAAVADLQTSLAIAYTLQDHREKAEVALSAALQAVPDYVPALIVQARELSDQRNSPAAFMVLDKALAKAPDDHDVRQLQGDLLWIFKGDAPGAINAYKKAIASRNTSVSAYAGLLTIYLSQNDLASAKVELAALRRVRPDHPRTKFFAGRMAYQQGDYKTANDVAQLLLKVMPDDIQVLELAGATALKMGSTLQAEQFLGKALQVSPGLVGTRRLLTQLFVESGQAEKALSTALPLLDKGGEPDSKNLNVVGLAYLQNGNLKMAKELFARAHKLDPADARSRTALAATQLSSGNNADMAFGELEAVALTDAGIGADLTLIAAHLQRQEIASALKAIDRLGIKQPDKPLAPNLRGRVMLLRGNLQGARQNFETAAKIDPLFFPALESLAALDLQDNKPELAEQRFTSVLNVHPAHAQALLALARLRAGAGKSRDEVVQLITKAVASDPSAIAPRVGLVEYYLERQDFKLALDAAQAATTALPNSVEILQALAQAQLTAGDVNQSLRSYGRLVALWPRSAQPLVGLAAAQVAAKNPTAAIQSVKQALALAPDFAPAQKLLIGLNQQAGRHEDAMAIARSVQKRQPDIALGYLYEGDIEAFQKHWSAAARAYRAALDKQATAGPAQKLHTALMAGERRSEADALAAAWLMQYPQDADFGFYLGDVALAERNYTAARARFSRVIELQPSNAEAHNNLAWAMGKLKVNGALEHAERANKLRPDRPAFLDTWATLLAEDNKMANAIELERKALAQEPGQQSRRLTLARFYLKAGDKTQARHELEMLLAAGNKAPEFKEAQQILNGL